MSYPWPDVIYVNFVKCWNISKGEVAPSERYLNTENGITLHWLHSNNQWIKSPSLEPNFRGCWWRKEVPQGECDVIMICKLFSLCEKGSFSIMNMIAKCGCIILLSYLMLVSTIRLWLLYIYVLIFVRKYFTLGQL
jgi:hypothetical protein